MQSIIRATARPGAVLALLATALLAFAGAAGADNEVGALPGGTSIEVAIVSPADGAVVNGPNVPVTGTAAIGEADPIADTAIVYVIDVSGSTDQGGGCGGDQNGDGSANFILDCEIAAARALNQDAIATGTVLDVGVVAFASNAQAGDVGPAAGVQTLTGPDTDANAAGGPDVEQVLTSAFSTFGGNGGLNQFTVVDVGIQTNFAEAVADATAVAAASSAGTKLVVFLSDGEATAGGTGVAAVAAAALAGVRFETFAIGTAASCTINGQGVNSSLGFIATQTGGTCTHVEDIADLPDVVPGVIQSRLTQLAISVDQTINNAPDGAFSVLPNTQINPDLPLLGPANVTYATSVGPLAPGLYEICVRATGTDGGGSGSVVDCHRIRVNAPPSCDALTASPRLLWPPNHKLRTVTVSGGVDPNGDPLTTVITGVTQDEPVDGLGDGNTAPDAFLGPAPNQVRLRAERSGLGDGRVYRIAVTVTDSFGLSCTGTVRVGVPHDQGGGSVPIDSAPPSFNSLIP